MTPVETLAVTLDGRWLRIVAQEDGGEPVFDVAGQVCFGGEDPFDASAVVLGLRRDDGTTCAQVPVTGVKALTVMVAAGRSSAAFTDGDLRVRLELDGERYPHGIGGTLSP